MECEAREKRLEKGKEQIVKDGGYWDNHGFHEVCSCKVRNR